MSRIFLAIWFAMLALFGAEPARATVVVDHVFVGPAEFTFGDTFQIDVRLSWDGQGALKGVFSSTTYDPTVIQYVSNTLAPVSILSFVDDQGTPGDPDDDTATALSRFTTAINQPGDPIGVLRTVQYRAIDPVDPRAATTGAGQRIMTLTFRVIGFGQTNIATFVATGDTGAIGDVFVAGASVCIWTDGLCSPPVPEPTAALSIGLGLAGLALFGRRDRV